MVGPFTEFHNTPNKSIRQNVPRLGVVLHHAAMTNLDALIYLEMGAKQVNSSATCKDDRLPQMMPFDIWRAWSLSDAYWDSALRSVETCNESVDGWTVSMASHRSLARAVAFWAQIDGFWPHRDGDPEKWTVLGHREMYVIHDASYATACPGGLDLNLVTRLAQDILRAGTAGGDTTPIKEADVAIHRTFQNKVDLYVRPQWQRFPTRLTPTRLENIATGTGPGLFDVILNLYLVKFGEGSQIEGRVAVVNAKTSVASYSYTFTVEGSPTGSVHAAVPSRFNVPAGSYVFLELRTVAGPDPVVDVWGADIAVLTVA